MTDQPQNREQRRHPEKAEQAQQEPPRPHSGQQDLVKQGSQDVQDPRAKASRHGKTTADKWNQ